MKSSQVRAEPVKNLEYPPLWIVSHDRHLADAFDRLDADQKGYISKEDLRNILGPSSNHDEVQRMFEEADHDGDGEVNYEEFLQVMFSDPDKMETHDKPGTDVDVQ